MGNTMNDWRIRPVLVEGLTCEEVAWQVIEEIWMDPADVDDKIRLEQLTPGQRAVYALTWTEREVCNGGFHQYFWNPTGGLARAAADGAMLLGIDPYGELIDRAAEVGLGTTERLHQSARQERLDRLTPSAEEDLDGLGDQFYDLLEELPLYDAFCRYIDAEPAQFFREEPTSPEERAKALLALARRLIAARPPRDFDRIEATLRRAEEHAIESAAESLVGQIHSLLDQLPMLRGD